MSQECIRNCPRIQEIIDNMDTNNLIGAVGPIHPDMLGGDDTQAQRLLAVCEASYDCPGPTTTEDEVVRGFFTKRVELEERQVCGLPDERFDR